MRALVLVFAFAASACTLPMTWTPPDGVPPSRTRTGDIEASVPHGRDEQRARDAGAAECAKYGRVPRYSRSDGGRAVYDCVDPATAAQSD